MFLSLPKQCTHLHSSHRMNKLLHNPYKYVSHLLIFYQYTSYINHGVGIVYPLVICVTHLIKTVTQLEVTAALQLQLENCSLLNTYKILTFSKQLYISFETSRDHTNQYCWSTCRSPSGYRWSPGRTRYIKFNSFIISASVFHFTYNVALLFV